MMYNKYNQNKNKDNRNSNNTNNRNQNDDNDNEFTLSELDRDVNSLISGEYVKFTDDYDDGDKQKKKKNKSFDEDRNQSWSNPLFKLLKNDNGYDRDDMLNAMVKKEGLYKLIDELKNWKSKGGKKPSYIYNLTRDISFAAALPEAINKLSKKDELLSYGLKKSDLIYLMDEILVFLNNSYDQRLIDLYGEDAVESMRKAYINILYKYNKKKVKKFKDIKNIPDSMVKRLVVLTAGKNVRNSIYQLLKFLYREADDTRNTFNMNTKNITKILKICYGKDNMPEVIKCIMLEKVNTFQKSQMSKSLSDVWTAIDEIMRSELEHMDKKDIEKIIRQYIVERKRQERGIKIPRRLGDRRSIHPDDYPKLTKIFENIEEKDFSVIGYLR